MHATSSLIKKPKLYVDLVPKSAWYSNLRSELTPIEWKALQRLTFKKAGYCCEICGKKGTAHPVECHERWLFDETCHLQILQGTEALCPACHEATHYGLAELNGHANRAKAQIGEINNWSPVEIENHIKLAFQTWRRLSDLSWELDATWLLDKIELSAETRNKIMEHALGLVSR